MLKKIIPIILIFILFACEFIPLPPSGKPVINMLLAEKSIVTDGEEIQLSVNATDPNGDLLTYKWLASTGQLVTESGNTVRWIAPSEDAVVKILVMVTDGEADHMVTGEIMITVVYIPPVPTPKPTLSEEHLGGGEDGSLVIDQTFIANSEFTRLTSQALGGDTILQVTSNSSFTEGDEIFIVNSQGMGAGTYEFAFIDIKYGTTYLTLKQPVKYGYRSTDKVVIYKVPHYEHVTVTDGGELTVNPWDGTSGGVMVFRVNGTLKVEGTGKINVSGKGYRGSNRQADNTGGIQGEGYLGIGTTSEEANASGGGGSGDWITNTYYTGGGGGGGYAFYGEDGETGSYSITKGAGGIPAGNPQLTKLFFGGAGGTGNDNDSLSAENPNGGHGGGIIFISAGEMIIKNITANGFNGGRSENQDGGAGGGAGGSIYLTANSITMTGAISATGGTGFAPPDANGGKGGNGSVGRIRLEAFEISGITTPEYYRE